MPSTSAVQRTCSFGSCQKADAAQTRTASVSPSRVLQAQRHAFEASHDHLTGLPNRLHLHEKAEQALVAARRDDRAAADGPGLLQLGQQHLWATSPAKSCSPASSGLRLLTRWPSRSWTGRPPQSTTRGLHLPIEGSLGVACHPQDAANANELFQRADLTMCQAKGECGSWLR